MPEITETTYADPEAVREWAKELTDSLLQCRELGHKWSPLTALWNTEQRAFERTLRCPRCHTKRIQALSRSGEVLKSHYEYPDGYLVPHLGRVVGAGRDFLRLESVTRLMRQTDERGGTVTRLPRLTRKSA